MVAPTGDQRCLCSVAHLELVEDAREVVLDGLQGRPRERAIWALLAPSARREHVSFALGEPGHGPAVNRQELVGKGLIPLD